MSLVWQRTNKMPLALQLAASRSPTCQVRRMTPGPLCQGWAGLSLGQQEPSEGNLIVSSSGIWRDQT